MEKIKLGVEVKDKVTGMKGVVIARCEYLNGCVQFCVKPKMGKDGKYPDGQWIDIGQVEYIGNGIAIKQKPTGGAMQDMPNERCGA